MRLLLVEDDSMNVTLFADVLEDAGHTVVVARDGTRGRDLALAERFDLCIFDIHLPGLRGDDAARALRAAGMTSPLIALSSSALASEVERGLGAGFDAYLTKPISPAELREAVRRYGRPAA
ncbi:MAG TPA: response regulator [Candidatus Limnocylindria bacterium]|nr:response regulator [Candidatus Limnocylindria bacterium]